MAPMKLGERETIFSIIQVKKYTSIIALCCRSRKVESITWTVTAPRMVVMPPPVLVSERFCQVGLDPLLRQPTEDCFSVSFATYQSEQRRTGARQMDPGGSGSQKLTPVVV